MQLNRFYYLGNFSLMLEWLIARYEDLLSAEERGFAADFLQLPQLPQALLVRMLMRKGTLFRADKLRYLEIPDLDAAAAPLIELGWLDDQPSIGFDDMFRLLRRNELRERFTLPSKSGLRKSEIYEELEPWHADIRCFDEWRTRAAGEGRGTSERVYRVTVTELCECLRLLYFGNFRQDLSEFVLADLGVFKYETVDLGRRARAFDTRPQIEAFFQLYRCRRALHEWAAQRTAEGLDAIVSALPGPIASCDWLDDRRQRLRFDVARELERRGDAARAVTLYRDCTDRRAAPRLARLQCPKTPRIRRQRNLIPTIAMTIPPPDPVQRVEYAVLAELTQHGGGRAAVHYVENVLVNSLFGLLCWRAVFAPVPGAFFHAYHHGPADLTSERFRERRFDLFAECLGELDSGTYGETIRQTYRSKYGIASPFVHWAAVDEALLSLALDCIPAAHLRVWFDWILGDVRNNRAGFPDLIQFWPAERRYALIEVKGPGDRLQENQRRLLEYCLAHEVPVTVVHVQWSSSSGLM